MVREIQRGIKRERGGQRNTERQIETVTEIQRDR